METRNGSATSIQGAHLVGSVALANTDEALDAVSRTLGRHLRRIPDGETGLRGEWVRWLGPTISRLAEFDVDITETPEYWVTTKLREGADAAAVDFGPLGYAENAETSYRKLLQLRSEGRLPESVRMQVSIPTPAAASILFEPSTWAQVESRWEAALLEEVERVAAVVPPHDLAIQWDVAVEVLMIEGAWPWPEATDEESLLAQVARCIDAVPPEAEVGIHLCYGDYEHKHAVEPKDTAVMVRMANSLVLRASRPLNWVHMPVPQNRDDLAYFQPLSSLETHGTELYLGVVGYFDGEEAARKRAVAASTVVERFGVGTECGMGRCQPHEIGELLAIHAALAEPLAT